MEESEEREENASEIYVEDEEEYDSEDKEEGRLELEKGGKPGKHDANDADLTEVEAVILTICDTNDFEPEYV